MQIVSGSTHIPILTVMIFNAPPAPPAPPALETATGQGRRMGVGDIFGAHCHSKKGVTDLLLAETKAAALAAQSPPALQTDSNQE